MELSFIEKEMQKQTALLQLACDLLREQNEEARRVRSELMDVEAMRKKLLVSLQATQLAYRELQAAEAGKEAPEGPAQNEAAHPQRAQRLGGKRG